MFTRMSMIFCLFTASLFGQNLLLTDSAYFKLTVDTVGVVQTVEELGESPVFLKPQGIPAFGNTCLIPLASEIYIETKTEFFDDKSVVQSQQVFDFSSLTPTNLSLDISVADVSPPSAEYNKEGTYWVEINDNGVLHKFTTKTDFESFLVNEFTKNNYCLTIRARVAFAKAYPRLSENRWDVTFWTPEPAITGTLSAVSNNQ